MKDIPADHMAREFLANAGKPGRTLGKLCFVVTDAPADVSVDMALSAVPSAMVVMASTLIEECCKAHAGNADVLGRLEQARALLGAALSDIGFGEGERDAVLQ